MNKQFKIVQLQPITIVGIKINTSLQANETSTLWRSFRSRLDELENTVDENLISAARYPEHYSATSYNIEFEKWAARQVSSIESVPPGMDSTVIQGGMFARFEHVGPVTTFHLLAKYIYGEWINEQPFELVDNYHFELFNEARSPMAKDAYEEVFIPIRISD